MNCWGWNVGDKIEMILNRRTAEDRKSSELYGSTTNGLVVNVLTFGADNVPAIQDFEDAINRTELPRVTLTIERVNNREAIASTFDGKFVIIRGLCYEGCEARHCSVCEGHYFMEGPGRDNGLCDGCEINRYSAQTQQIMENAERHGVDPYAAVQFMFGE